VEELLRAMGLYEFWPSFEAEDIHLADMLALSEDELGTLVPRLGPRKRIAAKIVDLQARQDAGMSLEADSDEEEQQPEGSNAPQDSRSAPQGAQVDSKPLGFEEIFVTPETTAARLTHAQAKHDEKEEARKRALLGPLARKQEDEAVIQMWMERLPEELRPAMWDVEGAMVTMYEKEYAARLKQTCLVAVQGKESELSAVRNQLQTLGEAITAARERQLKLNEAKERIAAALEDQKRKAATTAVELTDEQRRRVLGVLFKAFQAQLAGEDVWEAEQVLTLTKKTMKSVTVRLLNA
jgi:hypothetical protein